MPRVIESNIRFKLQETEGKLGDEIIIIFKGDTQCQLTPWGAAALAQSILRWAIQHDKALMERFPNFLNYK
jgi:hypothetical protein